MGSRKSPQPQNRFTLPGVLTFNPRELKWGQQKGDANFGTALRFMAGSPHRWACHFGLLHLSAM